MGAKPKDVGGGPAVGLANDWTSFLKQGLESGQFGGFGTAPNTRGRQQTPADGMMRADPLASTRGIGGYINNALSGNLGAQGYTPDTSGLQGQVGAGKFNFSQFNPQTVDFSQFQNPLQGYNASAQQIGQAPSIAGNQQFQGALAGLQNYGNMDPRQLAQLSSMVSGGNSNLGGPAPNVSMGNPDFSAYQPLWDRQRAMGQADTLARFGASGGASFGTPAAFAQSNFLNENAAQQAASAADIGRQQQGLNLQQGQINSNNYNAWQNNMANMAGINSSLFGNLYGTNVGALQSGAGLLGNALSSDANNYLTGAQANAQNNLSAQGLNLDALKSMGGLNLDALKAASQQGIDVAGLFNQNQGMQAQNQLGAAGMNADILSNILGYQGDAAKFGEGQRQFDLGLGSGVMGQLMGQYGNLADKGIAQRQTVMQPSGFQNAVGAISGLAGAVAPLITGGFNPMSILGGMGGSKALNLGQLAGTSYQAATGGLVTEDGIYPSVQHMAFGGIAGLPGMFGNPNRPAPQAGGLRGVAGTMINNMRAQPQGNAFGFMQRLAQGPAPMPMSRAPLNFGGAPNPNVNVGSNPRGISQQQALQQFGGPMVGAPASGNLSGAGQIYAQSPQGQGLSSFLNKVQAQPGYQLPQQPGSLTDFVNRARNLQAPIGSAQGVGRPMISGPSPLSGFGGRTLGFADGGEAPGMSGDTVPAMLTPGENVITKHVSDLLGPFAQMLNDLRTPEQIKKVRKAIGDAMGAGLDESFVAGMQEQTGGMPQ